jgi:hypothetical protein
VDDADRERLEIRVRDLCVRGDHAGAATAIVQGYGPEFIEVPPRPATHSRT